MLEHYRAEIGANVRTARLRAGLSQQQAAQRMMPPASAEELEDWETGAAVLSVRQLDDLCRVLGVHLALVLPALEMESPQFETLMVRAELLRTSEAVDLVPLAAWAAGYGDDVITITPDVLRRAAQWCGMTPFALHHVLTMLMRAGHRGKPVQSSETALVLQKWT
ncbi:helix-turn-helix domain-containing protein [Saccharothrix sp. AJ9571]|nr:helix-turn-helix domain-containing protein [Saccharothrix sp. AJ9571]